MIVVVIEMVVMDIAVMLMILVALVAVVVMMVEAMVTGTSELCPSLQVSSESKRLGCCNSFAWMDSLC